MNTQNRIAILGAGPAGLSAAMYLEKKGCTNYTVFEKEDHVGGKCFSPSYNGRRYEMGAVMGAPNYFAVHDVEEFCGITHDGPQLIRSYRNKNGREIDPFNPKKNPLQFPQMRRMRNQVKRLAELLETKYKGYDVNGHRGVAEGRYDGYAATGSHPHIEGHNENLKDLALPFREFCRINAVDLVQNIWIGPYTSFGCGYFDEIPAAYVLKYLDFATAMYFINLNLWTWKDGTQSIWEHLNDKLQNHARLSSDVTSVERKDGKVYLTVSGRTEEFDKLIVTSPLQFFGSCADIREDEKKEFAKIDCERYDVLAFGTKPEDHPEISCYVPENMEPERRGHLVAYYSRWRDDIRQPITAYALRSHRDQPEIPYDVCRKTVLADLKTMHSPASNVILEKSWHCFPHICSEDYAGGWYDRVEAMQDKYDTFYAGEIMSFGNMEETCEYSRDLIERFF